MPRRLKKQPETEVAIYRKFSLASDEPAGNLNFGEIGFASKNPAWSGNGSGGREPPEPQGHHA